MIRKLFIISSLIFLSFGISSYADVVKGNVYINGKSVPAEYTILSENTVSVGSGQNACIPQYTKGFLTIPGTVDINGTTYTVVEVNSVAFRFCDNLTGVEIGENVRRVGNYAFVGCKSLKEITLPATMESLGSGAFISCLDMLTAVTCRGQVPPTWEYNDVFVFHSRGIGDTEPGFIPLHVELFVPEGTIDTYRDANYTNPSIGWNYADGWGSFNSLNLGQSTFHIYRPYDLESLHDILSYGNTYNTIRKVVLENDIDMTDYPWTKGIGYSEEEPFLGSFDGQGHTISNLHINNTNGPGGLFTYFGGHFFSNLKLKNCTFSGVGSAGAFAGVSGYCYFSNLWVEGGSVGTAENQGFILGKCLTTGGANFNNIVVKDVTYNGDYRGGGLVGYCYGGRAKTCAIICNTENYDAKYAPFVGSCESSNQFYVENSYATSRTFKEWTPAENVIYNDHVVLNSQKTITATSDCGGHRFLNIDEYEMNTLYMVELLGINDWVYCEGYYPLPAFFHDYMVPQPNRVAFFPYAVPDRPNALVMIGNEPSAFSDLSYDGYISKQYQTTTLWINDEYKTHYIMPGETYNHNSFLPISRAAIKATDGIIYERTLEATPNGTTPFILPIGMVDDQGNPVLDDNGDYIVVGDTTLYEVQSFLPTGHAIYLPYSITLPAGARAFDPKSIRFDGNCGLVTASLVEDGHLDAWHPYFIVVDNGSVNLGTTKETIVYPIPPSAWIQLDDNDYYRMQGSLESYFNVGHNIQNDFTWRFSSDRLPSFRSYFCCFDPDITDDSSIYFKVIEEFLIKDDSDNQKEIKKHDNVIVDAMFLNREFYKDNSWQSLCIPFDVSNLTGTPFEGAEVCTLKSTALEDGTLTVSLQRVNSIEAGMPYLIKWANGESLLSPVFQNAVIKNSPIQTVKAGEISFSGSYAPVKLKGGDSKTLFIGANNRLYFPEDDVTINACRAYFTLNQDPENASAIRNVVLRYDGNDLDGTELIINNRTTDNSWYSIDGRRFSTKPTVPGIYINNGKKVVIK